MVSPAYVILGPKDANCTRFSGYLFKTHRFLHMLIATSQGLTKVRLHFDFKDFTQTLLPSPQTEEQRKVAYSLLSLDETIAVQTEKFDILKAHKEGLMQQLFPSSGTVGKLRQSAK